MSGDDTHDLPPLCGRLSIENGSLTGYARIGGVTYRITTDSRGGDGWRVRFSPVAFSGDQEAQEGFRRLL